MIMSVTNVLGWVLHYEQTPVQADFSTEVFAGTLFAFTGIKLSHIVFPFQNSFRIKVGKNVLSNCSQFYCPYLVRAQQFEVPQDVPEPSPQPIQGVFFVRLVRRIGIFKVREVPQMISFDPMHLCRVANFGCKVVRFGYVSILGFIVSCSQGVLHTKVRVGMLFF